MRDATLAKTFRSRGPTLVALALGCLAAAASVNADTQSSGSPARASAGARPPWPVEAQLFGSDQGGFWNFGKDVWLDGTTAIVGASGADIGNVTDRGAAYIFVREGDVWIEQAELLASDGAENDEFGWSVAVDGDTAVVGARLADVGAEGDQGAVYVFLRIGEQWLEIQKLTASDGEAIDWFGYSVALDGDTLAVGAVNHDCSGAVYVFFRQGGWIEEAKLFDPDGQCADAFGKDIALEGITLLVGADSAEIDGDGNRGAAYVFTRGPGGWTLEQKLLASDGANPDQFGTSVALDGDVALIGAEQKEIDGNPRQGAAYIFRRSGTTWTEEQRLTASDGGPEGSFGTGAAILGDLALVGAEFDFPGEPEQGVVYEYRLQGDTWVEIQKFAAPEGNLHDGFGRELSLSEDRLIVSNNSNLVALPPGGAAWIFRRPVLFEDGFESGDTGAWDQAVQ